MASSEPGSRDATAHAVALRVPTSVRLALLLPRQLAFGTCARLASETCLVRKLLLQAISVYMVASLTLGAGQAYLFTRPAVQRLLRIPSVGGRPLAPVSFRRWLVDAGLRSENPRKSA